MESAGFKEWSLVCDALGRGRQSVILRKGGIAEGRGGFSFRHRGFFLFPTFFHEQIAKVRIATADIPAPGSTIPNTSRKNQQSGSHIIDTAVASQFGGMQEWSGRRGLIHS